MQFNQWRSEIIEPGESEVSFLTGNELRIDIKGNSYSCARIIGRLSEICNCFAYGISADYSVESDGAEYKLIPVITQYDSEGNRIVGDYYEINGNLCSTIRINEKTEYIETEYLFYSFGNATLNIKNITVTPLNEIPQRKVNVATAYFKRSYTSDPEVNMKNVERIIKSAAADKVKPDVICFTETTYDRGLVCSEDAKWISRDSKPVKKIQKLAKEYGMYIIYSIHELDGKRKYNTALLISDNGEIVGSYRKTHLTYLEFENGINPGTELPVFELPFGKIGIMICWDQWFPGVASTLFKKGAEIVFVPTAGNPVSVYCSRAYENGGYVVVSGCHDELPSSSCIISQSGEIMAEVESAEKGYAVASIDLNEHKYVEWLSFRNGYGANMYPVDVRHNFINMEVEK